MLNSRSQAASALFLSIMNHDLEVTSLCYGHVSCYLPIDHKNSDDLNYAS